MSHKEELWWHKHAATIMANFDVLEHLSIKQMAFKTYLFQRPKGPAHPQVFTVIRPMLRLKVGEL